MRWRWLFGNFADPEYRLDAETERDLSTLAHKRHMPAARLFWWTVFAILLPIALLYKFVIPLALKQLGMMGQTIPSLVVPGLIIVSVWVLSAYVYGRLYVRPVRRAMRDQGIDVCLGCGYLLTELPRDVARCPECGRGREPAGGGETRES